MFRAVHNFSSPILISMPSVSELAPISIWIPRNELTVHTVLSPLICGKRHLQMQAIVFLVPAQVSSLQMKVKYSCSVIWYTVVDLCHIYWFLWTGWVCLINNLFIHINFFTVHWLVACKLQQVYSHAGLPWGWHFNPHTHPIPTGIPIGIHMGIPIYPRNPK